MATVTKKELVDRIADSTKVKRVDVKLCVQSFLDNIITELGKGNRLEFRDFGVFEVKHRQARSAQNPRTLVKVWVPAKRTVKFKVGRLMKQVLTDTDDAETSAVGAPDDSQSDDQAGDPGPDSSSDHAAT